MLLLLGFSCLLRVCLCVCAANINRDIFYAGVVAAGTNIEIETGSTPYAGWSENESFADIHIFIYFKRHTRILDLQQDYVRSKTLSMKLWHCWHWGFGHTWASAFFSGWMLLARWVDFMCTVGSSTRILTRLNITLFILPAWILCAHPRSTTNSIAIGYFNLLRISGADKTKPSAVALILLLIFARTFPSGRCSAGWYLTHSDLHIPDLPKNRVLCRSAGIYVFHRHTRTWTFIANTWDQRQNTYCCHFDSCVRPHTNRSS